MYLGEGGRGKGGVSWSLVGGEGWGKEEVRR